MPLPVDTDFLSAALVGYQQKLQEIDARMADLRLRLGGLSPAPVPATAAPKRMASLAARRRMATAQRKRWAGARKAKAESAATPAPARAAKKKRRLSPEGRARIIAATKRRWATARRFSRLAYDESCLAEKDRLRLWLGDILKCPKNGLPKNQNPDTFLARHGRRLKCCGEKAVQGFSL
jgi:hypothetical protein